MTGMSDALKGPGNMFGRTAKDLSQDRLCEHSSDPSKLEKKLMQKKDLYPQSSIPGKVPAIFCLVLQFQLNIYNTDEKQQE